MRIMLRVVLLLLFVLPGIARAEVQEIKTPGGITAWLVEEHSVPTISIKLAFKDAGFASDPAGGEGRAYMLSQLLKEGAGSLSSVQFNEALEDKAIKLSFSLEEDMFGASLLTISEHKQEAIRLLGLALREPQLAKADIERVRSRLLADLKRLEENNGYVAGREWDRKAFGEHPYGRPGEGTPASLKALDAKTLRNYLTRYIAKDRMLVAVAGDITPEELTTLLDSNLGKLTAKANPEAQTAAVTAPQKAEVVTIKRDLPQSAFSFGTPSMQRKDPEFIPAYVMNYMLGGGGLTSRLSKTLREEKGLTYSAGTGLDGMLHSAVMRGAFSTRNDQAGEALRTMQAALKNAAEKGFTEAELKDAKQYLTGSFPIQFDTNGDIAGMLITMQLYDLGRDYLEKRNSLVEAVTLEQVNNAAKRILDMNRLLIVVVGDPKGM